VELAAIPDQRITLQMTEDAKVIYETIGKLAGLNVLFDPDYTSRRIRVALNKVTLEEALEIVALESKTFWRPVTPNTIFVASDTATKRRELEQSVIRTFFLSNVSQQTELQEIVNAIRTLLNVTRVQLVTSQSAIVMRGTPDQVLLAEKLINDIDRSKPEVVVEIAVMQVRRDKLRNLGISPPTSASLALAPTTTTSTGDDDDDNNNNNTTQNQINLNRLTDLDARDFVLTVPAATANFLMTDSSTKVMQNPQIRALQGQKASLKIGDRVPVATGSFQPGIGGVGINPLVNTQFQYIDVGVNIDITPTVHANREITLKLMLDVSSVTQRVNIGGIDQPIIGQRRIEHDIRLKEGEVNLLGGILEESDVKSLSGIPGLAQIPFFRYFFSSENVQRVENEIVFAVTPRLIRSHEFSELNRRAVDVGRGDTSINVRRASPPMQPEAVPSTAPPAPTQPQPQPQPQTPPANQPQAAVQQAPPTTQPEVGAQAQTGVPAAQAPAQTPAQSPAGGAALILDPATITSTPGGTVAVNLNVANADNVYSVPIQVSYDSKLLELVNVSNGGFLSQDGQPVTIVHRADPESGTIQLTASRPPGSGGVSGGGTVFVLTFIARGTGEGAMAVSRPGLRNPAMQAISATGGSARVTIR
jgi:general secretion pathway protein D